MSFANLEPSPLSKHELPGPGYYSKFGKIEASQLDDKGSSKGFGIGFTSVVRGIKPSRLYHQAVDKIFTPTPPLILEKKI